MLVEIGGLFKSGVFHHIGEVVADVILASVNAVVGLLDLPVDVHSLESSLRFVKTSGFEDSNPAPVIASVGLTIGGGGFKFKSPADSSNSSKIFDGPPSSSSNATGAKTGFASVVPRAMLVFLLVDILALVLVRQSALNACVSKLGIIQWVVGGVLLGFPATWLVDSVRHEYSFRAAFVSELVLIAGSFLWLCYGGATIFNTVSACVDSVAPLWWLSYASSVLSLSVAGTVIFCMVVTTVLSLVYGSSQSK